MGIDDDILTNGRSALVVDVEERREVRRGL
jgi:hypothetical protein